MKLTKLLSVLSAVALLLCAVPMLVLADTPSLTLDTPLTVIPGSGTSEVTFTPAQTGLYEWHIAQADPNVVAHPWCELVDASQGNVAVVAGDNDWYGNPESFFVYYLTAGEQYTLRVRDTAASTTGVAVTVRMAPAASALTLNTATATAPAKYFSYFSFTPTETEDYVFSSAAVEGADPFLRALWDEEQKSPKLIAGEDDDYDGWEFYAAYTLTAGETYTMVLSDYGETASGFSVTVAPYYGITEQPTVADPTVTVNRPDEVSAYQWHTVVLGTVAVTEDQIAQNWGGVYDAGTGTWSSDGNANADDTYAYSLFTLPLKEGDVLTITSSDTLDAEQCRVNTYYELIPEEKDGALVYTIPEEAEYAIDLVTDGDDSTFTLQVTTGTLGAKVDGQTTTTLSAYDKNVSYACVVTFKNGKTVTSRHVKMEPIVVKQPTVADPSVSVSFAKDVKTYEWYTVKLPELITDDDAMSVLDDVTCADGVWSHTDPEELTDTLWGYRLFRLSLQAGDVITVLSSDAIEPRESYVLPYYTGGDVETVYNGNALVCTVLSDAVYEFRIATDDDDSTFKVFDGTLTPDQKLDGQATDTLTAYEKGTLYTCVVTYTDGVVLTTDLVEMVPAIVKQPTADAPTVKVNFADDVKSYQWYTVERELITAEDASVYDYENGSSSFDSAAGTWTPTRDSYDDYGCFVIEVEAGESVAVQLAEDDVEYAGFEDVETGKYYTFDDPDEDGVYTYEFKKDGTYYLYVSEATVVKAWFTKLAAVDGQTTDTLTEREVGKTYRCVVTYEDGSTLTSDAFTWTAEAELALKQAQADAVAAMIDALPETITAADIDAVEAAKQAYDALPDDVKALVSATAKAKLDAALKTVEELKQSTKLPTAPEDIPPTGERSLTWLWAALALMSGGAVCLTKQKAKAN